MHKFFLLLWLGILVACTVPAPVSPSRTPHAQTPVTQTRTATKLPTRTRTITPTRTRIPTNTATRTLPGATQTSSVNDDPTHIATQTILDGVNRERRARNLEPFAMDSTLRNIAQTRSEDMLARNYFSHSDPQTGEDLFVVLIQQSGFKYGRIGENIAELEYPDQRGPTILDQYTAPALGEHFVQGWVHSPPHLENILAPQFHRTGIAIAISPDGHRAVATQIFSD